MWAIFLLAAMSVAIIAMLLVYIGNKVYLAIKKDNQKNNNSEKEGNNNDR